MYVHFGHHVKCLIFFSDLIKFGMSRHIFITVPPVPNLKEICPVGAVLINAGRRTDTTKLVSAFCNYANEPNYVVLNI